MKNIIKNILAGCYVLLVIIGLISVITKSFGIVESRIFITLLIIFTFGMMLVLREEENEELKDN